VVIGFGLALSRLVYEETEAHMFQMSVGLLFTVIGAAFGVGLYVAPMLNKLLGRLLLRRQRRAQPR
jgi:triphosphoribosyl-dephospho-CoA synthetase